MRLLAIGPDWATGLVVTLRGGGCDPAGTGGGTWAPRPPALGVLSEPDDAALLGFGRISVD